MKNLIRPDLLEKYIPYSSARDEAKNGTVFLNANESPFDFELHNGVKLNRYPEKQLEKLILRLSDIMHVNHKQIAVARGSDEFIDLLIRLFCRAEKDSILTCSPTYGMYAVCAKLQNARIIDVPLLRDHMYQLDLQKIYETIDSSVKIVFLCSPNNPTGNLLKKEDILSLCAKLSEQSIIVVDEAYIDFADTKSLAAYINEYPNLVILRTLSKAFGLANARCGILLANHTIIEWILKIITPYPLSSIITNLVLNALSPEMLKQIQHEIVCMKSERNKLITEIQKFSFIKKVWPSSANFILIETDKADEIMQLCAKEGIILRSMFDKSNLKNAIRLSIGLPEENRLLLRLFKGISQ